MSDLHAAATGTGVLTDDTTGTITIGDLTVRRLAFGAMRISGARTADGVRDRETARQLCRRVVERGVNFIDTANIYGYGESEEIIAEALRPYPADLVIATKAGFKPGKVAPGETSLPPLGRPEHIVDECDKSLRRLGVDTIDLYQVHVPDPEVPYSETVGAFVELQRAGKVRHIGVSNVSVEQLAEARSLCNVVSVQNRYNADDRRSDAVLQVCERDGIAFLPWAPVILNSQATQAVVNEIATSRGVTAQQVSLAWLLARSPVMVPIPGTSQVQHADENIDAGWLQLTNHELTRLGG
jgi:aryl-alcohol dehydrogenase-like predicted oxidoreductase